MHKYTQGRAVMQLHLFNAEYLASVQQYALQRSCYCRTLFLQRLFLEYGHKYDISLYKISPVEM